MNKQLLGLQREVRAAGEGPLHRRRIAADDDDDPLGRERLRRGERVAEHRPPRELSTMGVDTGAMEPLLRGQVARLTQHLLAVHDAEARLVFHHAA